MMREERRLCRRIIEIRTSVSPDLVVATRVHAEDALIKKTLVDGLKGSNVVVVLDERRNLKVVCVVGSLFVDVATEAAGVIAQAVGLRVWCYTNGQSSKRAEIDFPTGREKMQMSAVVMCFWQFIPLPPL